MIDLAERLAFGFGGPYPAQFDLNAALGGKGKSLAVMSAQLGLPVPPGFTLTTDACRLYMAKGWTNEHDQCLRAEIAGLEARAGRGFGSSRAPLLVSVRSGGSVSMPGMMDTVLNVGLCRGPDGALRQFADNAAFAADCRQRLEQTYAKAVGAENLPEEPYAQLRSAVEAVFGSWNGDRAKSYRRIEGLDDSLGTAVTVQAMVYGNLDDRSGTGVVFSRDPSTGEARLYGDILFRAQGEDVVSGAEKTLSVDQLCKHDPGAAAELTRMVDTLERHARDLVEVEFTIESGVLWMLQYRAGKRSPIAAVRIAHDMALDEGFPLTPAEALARTAGVLDQLYATRPAQDPGPPLATGLAASPGMVSGALVVDSASAVEAQAQGRAVILARPETSPADVEGLSAARGILTARGGLASHAAVVARGWGKPAVVGCEALRVERDGVRLQDRFIRVGETITIDGATGRIYAGAIAVIEDRPPELVKLLAWRDAAVAEATSLKPGAPAANTIDLNEDTIVTLLFVKGFCGADLLADLTGQSSVDIADRLAALAALVDAAKPRFLRLTPEGASRGAALIADHRNQLGEATALSVLRAFEPHNLALKKQVTAWQSRTVDGAQILNDHQDAAHDQGVIDQVLETHARTRGWLDLIAPGGALALYAARLDRAITRVRSGDHAYLVSPRVDSYHNIWFELHEYLIRLAGRTREQEEA